MKKTNILRILKNIPFSNSNIKNVFSLTVTLKTKSHYYFIMKIFRLFHILLLVGLFAFNACVNAPDAPGTYTAVGYANLIDTTGGGQTRFIDNRGTLVRVDGTDLFTYTDSAGVFRFDNIPQDKHTFYFYHDGYGIQRSTDKNYSYEYNTSPERGPIDHAIFSVELYPLSPLRVQLDSVYFDDSTYIHTRRMNVILGPSGDTIDEGTIIHDTVTYFKSILTVKGKILNENGSTARSKNNVTLFFGASPTVSCDSSSWIMNRGCADSYDHAFIRLDTSFVFRIYEGELELLKRQAFTSGETFYCVAYARPSYQVSSRDGFGTELLGSYPANTQLGAVYQKRYYTTIDRYPSEVRSFIMK